MADKCHEMMYGEKNREFSNFLYAQPHPKVPDSKLSAYSYISWLIDNGHAGTAYCFVNRMKEEFIGDTSSS